jgi:hypothetical protein
VVNPPSVFADSFPRYLRLTADNVTNTFNLIELTGGVTLTNLGNGTARLTLTGGTSGGITNATGPGITVASGILTLSTNGWQFGAAQTPWTTNIDAGGYSLLNVGTLAAANINFGDNSLADMLASRLSTNYNGAWLVGSGGSTNITGGGTWTLSGGAYTFVPATDASRAATGTVFTVTGNGNSGSVTVGTGGTIALGSDAGKVTTNAALDRLRLNDGGGLTNLPVAATPATNAFQLRTGSFRNATTNDFLGGIITGSEALDTASGTAVALFNTVVNAATNIYNGSAWFVFPWPMGGDATTLQLGFRKTGTTTTNFPLTLGYSNRFTGATASMVLTGQAAAADTTYWTNLSIVGSITTQAVQGAEWFLRWDPSFGATTNTTPGYMGVSMQGHIFK